MDRSTRSRWSDLAVHDDRNTHRRPPPARLADRDPGALRYALAVSRRTPVACSMRRSGHPSRPRARTWCFFSSPKILAIPAGDHRSRRRVNVLGRCYLTGRFSGVHDWPVLGVHRGSATTAGRGNAQTPRVLLISRGRAYVRASGAEGLRGQERSDHCETARAATLKVCRRRPGAHQALVPAEQPSPQSRLQFLLV
jgi:hypothetical protein